MEQQLPQTLQDLQEDLGRLAHKKENTNQALSSSVVSLQDSIDELLAMFKRANEELTLEQKEEQLFKTQLEPVHKKLAELSEQQETIANAIVSVSDAIDGLVNSVNEIKARMSALDFTTSATRLPSQAPIQPLQLGAQQQYAVAPAGNGGNGRPSYQKFDFNTNLPPAGTVTGSQLPPPPPPNQSIPLISPNELGEKKKLF